MCRRLSKVVVCSEVKPNFCKPPSAQLVKATQPFERLRIDFTGPLPSSTKNCYLLTIVDEYSRFPFAFPCASVDSKTVIAHFNQLFALFGMPAYTHSDRGAAFMSNELTMFLRQRGIARSRKRSNLRSSLASWTLRNGNVFCLMRCIQYVLCCVRRRMRRRMTVCFILHVDRHLVCRFPPG